MTPLQRLIFDSIAAVIPALLTVYLIVVRKKPSIINPKLKQLPYYDQIFSKSFLLIAALLTVSFLTDVVTDALIIANGPVSLQFRAYSFLFTSAISVTALVLAYRLFIKKRR